MPPAVEMQSLNHWTAREIPNAIHCKKLCFLDRVVGLYIYIYVCVCVSLRNTACFPGVSVVKDLPASAGDVSLIPG